MYFSRILFLAFLHTLFFVPTALGQAFTRLASAGDLGVGQPGGWGAAWGDYNVDGYPDLYIAARPSQLYRNNGDGTFTSVNVTHMTTTNLDQNSAVWTDVNNDGYPDLFVSHLGPGTPISPGQPLNPRRNYLYINDGPPGYTFTFVNSGDLVTSLNMTWTSSFSDFDKDGDVDLFVWGDQGDEDLFYTNDGSGGFEQVTDAAFLNPGEFSAGGQVLDMDGDGDEDILVVNFMQVSNELYRNMLAETGTATYERITTGDIVTDREQDLVASWGDTDNDGDMDVFMSVWSNRNDTFYRNDGGLTFTRIRTGPHVTDGGLSLGNAMFDFDNDGFLDIYVTEQQSFDRLYRNNGDGTFTKMTGTNGGALVNQSASGFDSGGAVADFDNDGDMDVVTPSSGGTHKIYRNETGNLNNWLHVNLVGVESNRLGIGAIVRAYARLDGTGSGTWIMRAVEGGPTGDRGQSHQRLHFGLGQAAVIDTLRVEWPSGAIDILADVEVNQIMSIEEGDFPVPISIESEASALSGVYVASPFPNPTTNSTNLSFSLESASTVHIRVFDLLGRQQLDINLGMKQQGVHAIPVSLEPLHSGLYLVRLEIHSQTKSSLHTVRVVKTDSGVQR